MVSAVHADDLAPSHARLPLSKVMTMSTHLSISIFKHGIWLAGSLAASQSEAILENPC